MIIDSRIIIGLAALALAATACTEPRAAEQAVTPAPVLEARLELSDSLPRAGTELVVAVRLHGPNAASAGSFTGRVSYDTTGLRYIADVDLTDGATRVTNPTPGLLRSAGLRAAGFTDGTLVAYRFAVLAPSAVPRMRLTMDELHQVGRADALKSLNVVGAPVMRVP